MTCHTDGCDEPGTDESIIDGESVYHCLTCRRAFVNGRNHGG